MTDDALFPETIVRDGRTWVRTRLFYTYLRRRVRLVCVGAEYVEARA